MLPAQRDQGFGVMTYSPLGVGLLSGVYTPGEPPPEGTLYATRRAGALERNLNEAARRTLEILREIAGAVGWSITPEDRARLDEASAGQDRVLD